MDRRVDGWWRSPGGGRQTVDTVFSWAETSRHPWGPLGTEPGVRLPGLTQLGPWPALESSAGGFVSVTLNSVILRTGIHFAGVCTWGFRERWPQTWGKGPLGQGCDIAGLSGGAGFTFRLRATSVPTWSPRRPSGPSLPPAPGSRIPLPGPGPVHLAQSRLLGVTLTLGGAMTRQPSPREQLGSTLHKKSGSTSIY